MVGDTSSIDPMETSNLNNSNAGNTPQPIVSIVPIDTEANLTHDKNNPNYKGRGIPFAKGNKMSKGHQSTKAANHFRNLVKKATTDTEMKAIWQKLKEEAMTGNYKCIELFLRYTLGLPKDIDSNAGSDSNGWNITIQQAPTYIQQINSTPEPKRVENISPPTDATDNPSN